MLLEREIGRELDVITIEIESDGVTTPSADVGAMDSALTLEADEIGGRKCVWDKCGPYG
jgi:hypothetical protein